VGDPLAFVFERLHLTWLSGVIAVSAVVAMASVLLVFQVGQPRIWMSMSRDGLLPKKFSKLHRKYRTPAFATIITGVFVAIPTLFVNLTEMTDLTSIGTLFAFVLVCGGVLLLDEEKGKKNKEKKGFRVPYYNSRYFLPPIIIILLFLLFYLNMDGVREFFSGQDSSNINASFWDVFKQKIPLIGFIVFGTILTVYAIIRSMSLIPVLGLLTNLYLMTELGITNWMRFIIWLVIGLTLYFTYGFKHSKLKRANQLSDK
jgi:amino acid transporter